MKDLNSLSDVASDPILSGEPDADDNEIAVPDSWLEDLDDYCKTEDAEKP